MSDALAVLTSDATPSRWGRRAVATVRVVEPDGFVDRLAAPISGFPIAALTRREQSAVSA